MRRLSRGQLALVLLGAMQATAAERIGAVEFFGYKDLDVKQLRASLPVHEGDEYSDKTKAHVRQAIVVATGKDPTDIAVICCDENGNRLLFIGLPGASYKAFACTPTPTGSERLPSSIMSLYRRLDQALEAAVHKGRESAEEDDSNGYSLIRDPAARSLQLAVRQWAVKNEQKLMRVLAGSSAAEHRRVASDALGYARQSRDQIRALVSAARDSDGEVRNNATRALNVLVRSNQGLATQIPPDTFIEMLNSGVFDDRNKGSSLLMLLTADRNPDLLSRIRSVALDSLTEMATWSTPSHAFFSRMIVGRVAGVPEDRLQELAWNGPVDVIRGVAPARP